VGKVGYRVLLVVINLRRTGVRHILPYTLLLVTFILHTVVTTNAVKLSCNGMVEEKLLLTWVNIMRVD
jgi:hypothetical protein